MRRLYGGRRIESVVHQTPDEKWIASVMVSWGKEGFEQFKPLQPQHTFDSIAEAEAWGIRCGKRWIDRQTSTITGYNGARI